MLHQAVSTFFLMGAVVLLIAACASGWSTLLIFSVLSAFLATTEHIHWLAYLAQRRQRPRKPLRGTVRLHRL